MSGTRSANPDSRLKQPDTTTPAETVTEEPVFQDVPLPENFFGPKDETARCVHCGGTYADHDSVAPCTETHFTEPSERVTHLVVIAREGVPEVTEFRSWLEARAFFDLASIQWIESYLCSVDIGPGPSPILVRESERAP